MKDPLPAGVRRALRLYRLAEQQFQLDQFQAEVRFVIRKLLLMDEVSGLQATALRLYAGLDDGRWRTYAEVGRLMNVTKQRVHQLLQPSKARISQLMIDKRPQAISRDEPFNLCGIDLNFGDADSPQH